MFDEVLSLSLAPEPFYKKSNNKKCEKKKVLEGF